DVERELRGHAPLTLGTAIPTGSGHLADHGVHSIIHTIVSPGLGEAARPLIIPDALEQAFDAVDRARGRSFAMPIIGVGSGASAEQRLEAARVVVETLIAHLRTRKHRIERGILVSRFEDDRVPLETLLIRARERLWTS
ncbi:MAG TPA: hypothetical protein PK819_13230, partial [Thermomicrobiales bacterium]|nr:hypothetical protein [Thermomicrobiales bacterium]